MIRRSGGLALMALGAAAVVIGTLNAFIGLVPAWVSIGLAIVVSISASVAFGPPRLRGVGGFGGDLKERREGDPDGEPEVPEPQLRRQSRVDRVRGIVSLTDVALLVGIVAGLITIVNGVTDFINKII